MLLLFVYKVYQRHCKPKKNLKGTDLKSNEKSILDNRDRKYKFDEETINVDHYAEN